MHHKKKDLGKDHIEGKESRLYGRQGFRTLKRESEVEMAEKLFKKMRNEFEKTEEEERKIEQLRTIE